MCFFVLSHLGLLMMRCASQADRDLTDLGCAVAGWGGGGGEEAKGSDKTIYLPGQSYQDRIRRR